MIDCHRAAAWELQGEFKLVKTADSSLGAVQAEWLISVWPPVFFGGDGGGVCSALSRTHPKVAKEGRVFSLCHFTESLAAEYIDIPLQIPKRQLLLLSKVKLIRSSRPTGRCLLHISTAWSPAQVPAAVAAVAAASESE